MRKIAISRFRSEFDNVPTRFELSLPELGDLLGTFRGAANKKGLPAWSPATFKPGTTRLDENVHRISCFVLDIDNGTDPRVFERLLEPYAHIVHSSYSHTDDYPKWRVVLPLARELWPCVWDYAYRKLAMHFGRGMADMSCRNPSRIYFAGCCPPSRLDQTFCHVQGGLWLEPDDLDEPADEIAMPLWAVEANRRVLTPNMFTELPPEIGPDGLPMSAQGDRSVRLDFATIAAGDIPDGNKHRILIQAIYRMRRQGQPIEDCKALVTCAMTNISSDRLRRSREKEIAYFMREIDLTWSKFSTDEEDAREGRGKRL